MVALTEKQLEVVRVVWTFRRDKGRPPTLREIGKVLGVSHVSAWERVGGIVKKGALLRRRAPGAAGRSFLEVPKRVADELELLSDRRDRLRAWAAKVARKNFCSVAKTKAPGYGCSCDECRVVEKVAQALETANLPDGV